MSDQSAVAAPEKTADKKKKKQRDGKRKRQPRYHVVLWDSDDHSYDYVIRMMQELFHYDEVQGFVIAQQVDKGGRAICLTTTREHAELKRDQIHAYGKDQIIARCKGSMHASIEPET